MATIVGTNGDETLDGTGGDDAIEALDGADYVRAWAGNDTLDGGVGDDTLIGGEGNDILTGGPGSDTFYIFQIADMPDHITDFGNGADNIQYGSIPPGSFHSSYSGADTLIEFDVDGNGVTDGTIVLDNVHAVLAAIFIGFNNAIVLLPPTAQDDLLVVASDTVSSGNVFLDHGGGPDIDAQGHGITVVAVNGNPGNVGVRIGGLAVNSDGSYTFDPSGLYADDFATTFAYTISDGSNTWTAIGTVRVGGPSIVNGTGSMDSITGMAGDDLIRGFDGNDTLNGNGGDDVIESGAGADAIDGGNGTNTVTYADSRAPVQVELLIGSAAEGGVASDVLVNIQNIIGTPYNDTISGNAANNVLRGDPAPGMRLISTSAHGQQANAASSITMSSFSPDSTKLLFSSTASNLISGDSNSANDVFLKDLQTGTVSRISTASDGTEANGSSSNGVFSPDGTKVAFFSSATNLVAGDTNGVDDVFVKNLITGAVTRVSVAAAGTQGNTASGRANQIAFSPDGTKLAFTSSASNLVPGDSSTTQDLFVKDLTTGEITRASEGIGGAQGSVRTDSGIAFSPDGTQIAFQSMAALVAGDNNFIIDVFIRNLVTNVTTRVSTTESGQQASNGQITGTFTAASPLVFSPDGTKIFFDTNLNLVPEDSQEQDVYMKDLVTGHVTLLTTAQLRGNSVGPVGFSADGTLLVFSSYASDLVPGDTNHYFFTTRPNAEDVFVANLLTGDMTRLSVNADGIQGNHNSGAAAVSPDGTLIALSSLASNLVLGDGNNAGDIFVVAMPGAGQGSAGNDTLNGNDGLDSAVFSSLHSAYTITRGLVTTVSGPDGSDTLSNVEKLVFGDATVNLYDSSRDFNTDSRGDVLFQLNDGRAALWEMNGLAPLYGDIVALNPGPTWHIKDGADFNNDGNADILWQTDTGRAAIWLMNGTTPIGGDLVGPDPGPAWHVIGGGDFNGDGKADILWQADTGRAAIWLMNGLTVIGGDFVGPNPGPTWHAKGSGDFNGDGKSDILWETDTGRPAIWLMDGLAPLSGGISGPNPGPGFHIKGIGDFNGDHKDDLIFQFDDGRAAIWIMDGVDPLYGNFVGPNPGVSWHVRDAVDISGDGRADLLWQTDTGQPAAWLMDGLSILGGNIVGPNPGATWLILDGVSNA